LATNEAQRKGNQGKGGAKGRNETRVMTKRVDVVRGKHWENER